jgi:phage terminase large subunit-like protein
MRSKSEVLGDYPLPLFLLKCRDDFKFFAEECLKFTSNGEPIMIKPFHMNWVEQAEKHNKIIVESGTRSGKTEIMGAMYPVWKMFTGKNVRILLISKTLEQASSNLLSRIKRYIEDNGLLKDMFIPDDYRDSWNATEIKTKNGCWVKNVPYNVNIRGYGGDIIIPDEIDSYDDPNIFFEHVVSRLSPKGRVIGISTPTGPTKIIGMLKEKNQAGILKGWSFIKTPYLVDEAGNPAVIENRDDILKYISIWPEQWSLEKLHEKWGDQGKANWMRNNMCVNLGEIDDAIFPLKNIVESFDYKRGFTEVVNRNSMYFIGADFAISEGPRADFDAYTVIEKTGDQFILVWAEQHKGWQRPEKVNRLKELFEKYYVDGGTYLIVDESNMGTMVMNDLRNLGVPVKGQNFHSTSRAKLLIDLSNVFSGRGIIIPRSPDADDNCVELSELLKEQATGFKRKRSDKTGKELIESRAAHDDLVISLAMAISEAQQHGEMDCMPIIA